MRLIEKSGLGLLLVAILVGVLSLRPSVDLVEDIGGAVIIGTVGFIGLALFLGSEGLEPES